MKIRFDRFITSGNEDSGFKNSVSSSCEILRLRGCKLQVHPKIEPQKQQDRRMGVPNLNHGAPSWSSSKSLWSSQVPRALSLSGLMRRSRHLTERLPLWQLGWNIYGKLWIMGKRERCYIPSCEWIWQSIYTEFLLIQCLHKSTYNCFVADINYISGYITVNYIVSYLF